MNLYFVPNIGLVFATATPSGGTLIAAADLDLANSKVNVYYSNGSTGTATPIETVMLNFSEFTVASNHLKTTKTSAANLNGSKTTLDTTAPMSFLRANTVVNFGRL